MPPRIARGGHRIKPEHRSNPAFDGTMALLNAIVEISILPHSHAPWLAPRSLLQLAFCIAGQDRLAVRLAAIDHNALRSSMPLECLARERLGGSEVTPLAEAEFHGVAIAVDGAVKVHSSTATSDIRFIHMPSAG